MKAVMLAANKIRLGEASIIVAGGMESMTNAPHCIPRSRRIKRYGKMSKEEFCKTDIPVSFDDELIHDGLWENIYGGQMGKLCSHTIRKYKISRKEQDEFALVSNQRAVAARKKFKEEMVKVKGMTVDEHPRPDTTLEKLSSLRVVFGRTITAGNASGLNDAAAALVVMSDKEARKRKLKPLATIMDYTSAFVEPKWFPLAVLPAVRTLLKRNKLTLKKIGLIELNEAFAGQTIAVQKAFRIPLEKLNVNGGAIALGHPIGASGARIIVTLLHEMKRRKEKIGLATLCIGGGGATAMLLRR